MRYRLLITKSLCVYASVIYIQVHVHVQSSAYAFEFQISDVCYFDFELSSLYLDFFCFTFQFSKIIHLEEVRVQ